MNEKQYRKKSEQLTSEQSLEERKEVLAALNRVQKGERISSSDLKIVQKELIDQEEVHQNKSLNIDDAIQNIKVDILSNTENISNEKGKFKKKNHDLNRLKRQRRLQIERERRAGGEREMS